MEQQRVINQEYEFQHKQLAIQESHKTSIIELEAKNVKMIFINREHPPLLHGFIKKKMGICYMLEHYAVFLGTIIQ